MRLSELVTGVPGASRLGEGDPDITSISYDSRSAAPGSIFVAIAGFKTDGHDYMDQALSAGASVVAVQADHEAKWSPILADNSSPALIVPDTRVALAQIAAALLDHPGRRLRTIGVTGTDGKTSLSHLLHHVLSSAGEKAGLISTAECRVGDELLPDTGRFTTPEAPEVQQMLSQMVEAGCRYVVIEATSHGLALHRVDECDFDIAVFTNLYPDHLDFHETRENYIAAKGRLFEVLDTAARKDIEKTAVLNGDDETSKHFRRLTDSRVLTYGLDSGADVMASQITSDGWGTCFQLRGFEKITMLPMEPGDGSPSGSTRHRLRLRDSSVARKVRIPTPGDFNVYNALAAYTVASAAGLDPDATVDAIETWPGAPGRMQLVDSGQPFTVLVDFAHAPESLRRLLTLARERSRGRIIAVFGCIGERDKDRRFRMGRVAAECADYTIVTDDNPYSEDREAIIAEIGRGLREAGKREGHDFAVIPDRREAISHAITMAVDGDAVILAGKGHERDVHLPDSTYPCHDPTVARQALRDLGHVG